MPVRLKIYSANPQRIATPLRNLLRLLKIKSGNWTITLVRDAEMAALHHRTMGDNTTTDVLTFDLRDHPPQNSNLKSQISNFKSQISNPKSLLDLDTVISLDVARRKAQELGHSIRHELLLYCLHSLLHVQGYDDLTPDDSQKMHAREDELLAQIGVGPVYSKTNAKGGRRKTPSPLRGGTDRGRPTTGSAMPALRSGIATPVATRRGPVGAKSDSARRTRAGSGAVPSNRKSKVENRKSPALNTHHSSLITHHSKRRAP